MPNRLPYWDKKFYYNIHCNRQRADWNEPLSYYWFICRLRRWMNLHDAIYTPCTPSYHKREEYKATVEDNTRRRQKLNEENVMILDFDEIDELEQKQKIEPYWESIVDIIERRKKNTNRIQIPKPKQSLLDRFISLFR